MRKTHAKLAAIFRRHPLRSSGVMLVVALALLSVPFRRYFVVNTTPSLPRGVYVRTDAPPAVGRVIEFRVPEAVRENLTGSVDYIIKPIVAGPGDDVDTMDGQVRVNGVAVASSTMQPVDSAGRALPQWRDHRRLAAGEFFVLSTRIPTSLDSRYYGPVSEADVVAVRRCLWAWGG